jgi:hypothetical protein
MKIQNKNYVVPAKAGIQRFIGYTGLNDLLDTRLLQASCLSPCGPHSVRSNLLQVNLSTGMTRMWDSSGSAPIFPYMCYLMCSKRR